MFPLIMDDSDEQFLTDFDASFRQQAFGSLDDVKDRDPTPKGLGDGWRFTPSMLDTNSFAFANFANQPPGYYTPTPGGLNTLYHSQAGDLHTPGMGMNTPLSMPHSGGPLAADASLDMHHFHPSLYSNQHFVNPFVSQGGFAPAQFVHQDSGFEGLDHSNHDSPLDKQVPHQANANALMSIAPNVLPGQAQYVLKALLTLGNMLILTRFRYHVSLTAPTAMIKHSEEIPISYLNKGQAYTLHVSDTTPLAPLNAPVKYRTFVRVSFEDQQQRSKPSACWQLWKEGRGTNEAHQRGGKLLAVEYVDPNQGGTEELNRRPQFELESASFDGFCVTWTPNPRTGTADCAISVRFNFLSTDFSHSKGVKGIPVRLCAKTEMITPKSPDESMISQPEVCYCKVKLFRDHGAERKLSNDVAHVKKTIEKLKQQIAQAESGMGNFGKRKRSGSISKPGALQRPGKVQKHKRTWSMDSQGDSHMKGTAEDDLHMKLATMQDMFSSTRPVSVLYLQGDEYDDPDLHPVQLSSETNTPKMAALTRQDTLDSKASMDLQSGASMAVSPTSSGSMGSPEMDRRLSGLPQGQAFDNEISGNAIDWAQPQPHSPEQSLKSSKTDSRGNPINVVGLDPTYQPPPERGIKPSE